MWFSSLRDTKRARLKAALGRAGGHPADQQLVLRVKFRQIGDLSLRPLPFGEIFFRVYSLLFAVHHSRPFVAPFAVASITAMGEQIGLTSEKWNPAFSINRRYSSSTKEKGVTSAAGLQFPVLP